jgi:hypothetical protein
MARILVLGLLVSGSAFAAPRLFPQPSLLTLAPEVEVVEPPARVLLATGAAAAMFSAPAALMLSSWVGRGSNNLIGALVPAMLVALLVPTAAVVFSEWLRAERDAPGRFRWLPALASALVVQLGLIVGAVLLGVSGVTAAGVALFTLADVVALPTVTTAMMSWTQRPVVASVPVLSGNF